MSLRHVHKTDRETVLRAAANRRADGACDVLADFYEADGQHSRADLWRRTINGERDLLVKHHDSVHAVDPRRNAMIWLLAQDPSLTYLGIAWHFNLTPGTIATIVKRIERDLALAAERETVIPTLAATRRLIAAGALSPSHVVDDRRSLRPDVRPLPTVVGPESIKRRGKRP